MMEEKRKRKGKISGISARKDYFGFWDVLMLVGEFCWWAVYAYGSKRWG